MHEETLTTPERALHIGRVRREPPCIDKRHRKDSVYRDLPEAASHWPGQEVL